MNFYDSIIEGAQELPATERGQLYTAALEYLYYGREPSFKMRPAPRALFVAMRPVFDNQRQAVVNGRKGGRPRKSETKQEPAVTESTQETETETKPTLFENAPFSKSEQEQEQELEKPSPNGEGKKTHPRFVPPTEEEVDEYLAERGLSAYLSGAQFVGYYGSQGWRKANGQRVTNWKLAASGWADRERKKAPAKGGSDGFDDFAL